MSSWLDELLGALGEEKVHPWDPDRLEDYARDASGMGRFAPDAVVYAMSKEDVQAVLQVASAHRIPVTPCASRTGKAGGSLPIRGGIALSLERMDRILSLSPEDSTIVVEPGVRTGAVMEAAEEAGLFYPPDPNSWETCTIGGNVATNAGGPRALKYGVTKDYVLGLEAVLPSGEVVRLGKRTIKGVAGYDLVSLFVGSEGTLGVITGITLKLIPRPGHVRTALGIFPDAISAGKGIAKALTSGIHPRTLELFDECAISATGRAEIFPEGAGAAVLAETDGDDPDAVMGALEKLGTIFLDQGAMDVLVASNESRRKELWATRRLVSEALYRLHPKKISEDVVVPRSKIPEAIERFKGVGARAGLTVATYGHAGDGNLHANVLYDTDDQKPLVDSCIEEIVRIALELGGTITGEHGVGMAKVAFLPWEQDGATLDLQRRIKRILDPMGIMNPGKIVEA